MREPAAAGLRSELSSGEVREAPDKGQELRSRTLIDKIDDVVGGTVGAAHASDDVAFQPLSIFDSSASTFEDAFKDRVQKDWRKPKIQDLPEDERQARSEKYRAAELRRKQLLEQSEELLAREKKRKQDGWQRFKQSLVKDKDKREKRKLQVREANRRAAIKRKLQRAAARIAKLSGVTISKDSPATSANSLLAQTRSTSKEGQRTSAASEAASFFHHPQHKDPLPRLLLELDLPYHPRQPRSRTRAVTASKEGAQIHATERGSPHAAWQGSPSANNEQLQDNATGQRPRLNIDLNLPPPMHQD